MLFGEKLKQLRTEKKWNQEETAVKLGVSKRTYQHYEAGTKYPRNSGTYHKIGEIFGVNPEYLITQEDHHIMFAIEKGGATSRRDVQALVTEIGALFAGGEITEDDKDKVLKVITDLYWHAKEKNKKYTRKTKGLAKNE
ncbi:MAG: helix-turn-helix domain-containing protein [Clostridiales bacterium]|jgi:transcriptional regulator with XRE-family HTH domain|nr:helix-turn-helix domain-containing protein [Clostridiales bacterium]